MRLALAMTLVVVAAGTALAWDEPDAVRGLTWGANQEDLRRIAKDLETRRRSAPLPRPTRPARPSAKSAPCVPPSTTDSETTSSCPSRWDSSPRTSP